MIRKPKYTKEMKINIVQQYLKGEATAVQIDTTSIVIEEPKSVVLDRPFI